MNSVSNKVSGSNDLDWSRDTRRNNLLVAENNDIQIHSNLPDWLHDEEQGPSIGVASTIKSTSKGKLQYKQLLKPKIESPMSDTSSSRKEKSFRICPENPCIWYFRSIHILSTIFAIVGVGGNAYLLYHATSFRGGVIHAYAALFCMIIVAVEIESRAVLRRVNLLENWIFRGLFYLFVGCITCMLYSISDYFSINKMSSI
jgi:hypothetical protein